MGYPVILCGKREALGAKVVADLLPEYEVIHFVTSPEAAKLEIAAILKGEQPAQSESSLGSGNYLNLPICVIMGEGYDEAAIDAMMDATKGLNPLPWLRPDVTKPAPPLGPAYNAVFVRRVKQLIPRIKKSGRMNETGVYYY